MVRNPYAEAAVAKARKLRALRLPAANPGGMAFYSQGMQAFLEAGGPRKSMMQSIHANTLTIRELDELIGMYQRNLTQRVAEWPGIDIVIARDYPELHLLQKVKAKKA